MSQLCNQCEIDQATTKRGMCQECDENYDYSLDIRKAMDAGKTEEERKRNIKTVMGKHQIEEMMVNAHPDSILGCMAKLKSSLESLKEEKNV